MLNLNLDKLPMGEQICVTLEICRRLQQRVALFGLKLAERNDSIVVDQQ